VEHISRFNNYRKLKQRVLCFEYWRWGSTHSWW